MRGSLIYGLLGVLVGLFLVACFLVAEHLDRGKNKPAAPPVAEETPATKESVPAPPPEEDRKRAEWEAAQAEREARWAAEWVREKRLVAAGWQRVVNMDGCPRCGGYHQME